MNRQKRIASCPTLFAKVLRNRDKEISHAGLRQEIHRKYGRHSPRIMGHSIKLPTLFAAVVSRGGYRVVCDRRLWSEVAEELQLPAGCLNSGIGLRRIYYEFLVKLEFEVYPSLTEKFLAQNYTDFSSDSVDHEFSHPQATIVERNLGIAALDGGASLHSNYLLSEALEGSVRSSNRAQDPSWHLNSNTTRLPDLLELSTAQDRTGLNDPSRLRELTELRLVELALESGFINEVEVALNSLLALSISPCTTGASTSIRLAHCRNLLSLLLATVGVYEDGSSSFVICDSIWRQQDRLDFLKFWHDAITEPRGRVFLRSDVFINADLDESDKHSSRNFAELFAPSYDSSDRIGVSNSRIAVEETLETSRVLLVATILVNLVTPPPNETPGNHWAEDDDAESTYEVFNPRSLSPYCTPLSTWRQNARYFASSPTALRFAFLCAYAEHSGIRQLGLQLLSSLRFPLEPPDFAWPLFCPLEWTPLVHGPCRLGDLTLTFLSRCIIDSPDRMSLIGALHFLANLATVPNKANEAILLDGLSSSIWPRLAQLLALPDLGIVCATLEALRCLTNFGRYACLFAWKACAELVGASPNAVPLILLQPLLALLTLEGQAMGSQSLHRIRLMQKTSPIVLPYGYQPQLHIRPGSTTRLSNHPTECSIQRHQPPTYQYTVGQRRPVTPPIPSKTNHQLPVFQNRPPFPKPLLPSRVNVQKVSSSYEQDGLATIPKYATISHRPQGGDMGCTGLMTLLASPSTCSQPVASSPAMSPTVMTTTSDPGCTSSSSTSRVVTSTSPARSLSELTDRLQMPPPSLPPPSALRRSAKSSHSRTSLSPNSKTSSSAPPPYSINPPITNQQEKQEEVSIDRVFSSGDQGYASISNTHKAASERIGNPSHALQCPPDVRTVLEPKTASFDDAVPAYRNSSSSTTFAANENFPEESRPDKSEDNFQSTNFHNGEPKPEELVSTHVQSDTKSPVQKVYPPSLQINGLKPGILQAAMDAIDGNLKDEEEMKRNGINELRDPINLKCEVNGKENSLVRNVSDNEVKKLPMVNGHLTDSLDDSLDDPSDSCDSMHNGTASSGSESSSDDGASESSPVPQVRRDRRLFKRRRRHGARNRWLHLKRRRYSNCVVSKSPTGSSPSKNSPQNNSPLKPLPLQIDPLPNSVLGPTWKPSIGQTPRTFSPSLEQNLRTISNSIDSKVEVIDATVNDANDTHEYHKTICHLPKYFCAWESCSSFFDDKCQLSSHVYEIHLMSGTSKIPIPAGRRCCRWRGCRSSSLARAPFALLSHVLDTHCESVTLESQHPSGQTPSTVENKSSSSSTSKLYHLTGNMSVEPGAHNDRSAWSIIRSIEIRQMQQDLWTAQHQFISANPYCRLPFPPPPQLPSYLLPPREGPVTKHLRVSAALILRNFVTYLEESRAWLLAQLPLLAELLMGCSPNESGLRTNDACSIVAQCLNICSRSQPQNNTRQSFLQCGPFFTFDHTRVLYHPQGPRGFIGSLSQPQHPHNAYRKPLGAQLIRMPVVDDVDLDAQTM